MVEVKNNPRPAKIKIMQVEKNLADDFINFQHLPIKLKSRKKIYYIRSGEDTPITERPLQIVIRRQFIKNKRAKDKP